MPVNTVSFSFFCTGKFAALKKSSLPGRKVVNARTENSANTRTIILEPNNLTAAF
jgi:hypothetical protein